jgi:hypothetical protein
MASGRVPNTDKIRARIIHCHRPTFYWQIILACTRNENVFLFCDPSTVELLTDTRWARFHTPLPSSSVKSRGLARHKAERLTRVHTFVIRAPHIAHPVPQTVCFGSQR